MNRLLQTALHPEILTLVQKIGGFQKQWQLSAKASPDYFAELKKTTIITSAGASTRIEGATLSDAEIKKRVRNLKIQKIRNRDEAEVAGYIDCKKYIFDHFADTEISEYSIRSLHRMMCQYLSDDVMSPDQRGAYKNITNAVVAIDLDTGAQEVIFETTPPGPQTEAAMQKLVENYQHYTKDPNYSDLEVIAAFIVQFLAIHPFRDGNGRMSRLLTDLCLLRQGYEFVMYSSHEKVVEDNKEFYYIALRQTQGTLKTSSDLNPWLLFFLKTLLKQTEILQKLIGPVRKGTLTKFQSQVLDLIQAHQPATIGFLERESGIKRVTLKSILTHLKEDGMIEQEGQQKGSLYYIKK